jgi:hypothetical protein
MDLQNRHVLELVRELRKPEIGLEWLAMEIVGLIQQGKTTKKSYKEEGQKRAKSGQTTEPYSSKEELQVAINVLRSRIVDPLRYWAKSTELASDAFRSPQPDEHAGPRRITKPRFAPFKFSLIDDLRNQEIIDPDRAETKASIERIATFLEELSSDI